MMRKQMLGKVMWGIQHHTVHRWGSGSSPGPSTRRIPPGVHVLVFWIIITNLKKTFTNELLVSSWWRMDFCGRWFTLYNRGKWNIWIVITLSTTAFQTFLTLTYREKYNLPYNPVQTQAWTCRTQSNLLIVLILTTCSLIFSILPCFFKCWLQSTALTALMDCDSGLEYTVQLSSLWRPEKGNIVIREMNGLSVWYGHMERSAVG